VADVADRGGVVTGVRDIGSAPMPERSPYAVTVQATAEELDHLRACRDPRCSRCTEIVMRGEQS
jgi:hypothetical protein